MYPPSRQWESHHYEEEEEEERMEMARQPEPQRRKRGVRVNTQQISFDSAADKIVAGAAVGVVAWFGWYILQSTDYEYDASGNLIGQGAASDGGKRDMAEDPMPLASEMGEVEVFTAPGGRPRHIPAPMSADQVNNLPVQVSMVVPSTRGAEDVSDSEYARRIKETRLWFSDHFGGDTSIRGRGGYVGEDGDLISEDVAIVESSMSIESYNDNLDALARFIRDMRDEWDQDTVLYKVEDQVFIYPERDYIDDTAYPSDIIEVI